MQLMENPNFQIGETALGESDTDSVVCGKRKRGEIKKQRKLIPVVVPQCDEAEPYMGEEGVEIENDGMVKEIKNDDVIKEIEKEPYDRETVLKYISQVRNSFGFNVDVRVPSWLLNYLSFIPLELSFPSNHDHMYMAAKFAIDEINVDMLVEVAKAVVVLPSMLHGNINHIGDHIGAARRRDCSLREQDSGNGKWRADTWILVEMEMREALGLSSVRRGRAKVGADAAAEQRAVRGRQQPEGDEALNVAGGRAVSNSPHQSPHRIHQCHDQN
ncbi:hypothetical protein SASPL_103228 [Salvia splendens]|uniref:Uncharacterized protein n=1 Tax=Salvia splendens TaxID=180675 RepID=A0A8X8YTE1_SALSN|nr:hypothetical protein SASPL_103228 [Salvia splendens]